jgi:hypothetical protein
MNTLTSSAQPHLLDAEAWRPRWRALTQRAVTIVARRMLDVREDRA